jgi:hypothetical protein
MPRLRPHEVQEDVKHRVEVGYESEPKTDSFDIVAQGRLAPVQNPLHILLLLSAHEDQEQNIPVLVIQERQDGFESTDLIYREKLRDTPFFTRL